MMKHSGALWICLVVVFVMSAMMSAAASAEPEFVTKAAVGEAVNRVPFTGSIGNTSWRDGGAGGIACLSGTVTGEVTGPKSVGNTVLVLHQCEGTVQCNTVGGGVGGEIKTEALAGKLGAITSSQPGLKLFSEAQGKGGTVFEAECGAGIVRVKMTGEVTGALAGSAGEGPDTGKLLSTLNLAFAAKSGIQKYQGFSEGEEAGVMGQLTATTNGNPKLSGWSGKLALKTVPATWGLGVTK
jgi:hypothetical protein